MVRMLSRRRFTSDLPPIDPAGMAKADAAMRDARAARGRGERQRSEFKRLMDDLNHEREANHFAPALFAAIRRKEMPGG